VAEKVENESLLGSLYFNLGIAHSGQAYVNQQPLDSSIAILRHGANLMRKTYDYEMLHRLEAILAGTLFVNENQQEAFMTMRSAYLTLDTLHTQNAEARLQAYYSQYQTEKVKRELLETQVNLSTQRQRAFYLIGGLALLGLLGLIAYLLQRIKLQRQRNEAEKRRIELEYGLLRTQMNPHFIFNALNSIQGFFVDRDFNRGNEYLGAFAMLMRQVLEQSTKGEISLEEELDSLHLYLQLEQARMGAQLSYRFELEPNLPTAEIMIPPMLLQPFVENAIWHGIAPKEGPGQVWVRIQQSPAGDALLVEIEDDGVGLEATLGRKSAHEPRGLAITRERLGKGGRIDLQSLKGLDQRPAGT
ncbi:MAG: histidine kinase, partial [Bacteroidota bacterium]